MDRLEMVLNQRLIDFIYASSVRDLELVVSFFFNLIDVFTDSGADSGRNFGSCDSAPGYPLRGHILW